MHKKIKKLAILSTIFFAFSLIGCNAKTNEKEGVEVHTFAELQNALNKQNKVIKIDDMDFEGRSVSLNYNVTLTSINEHSTIKNGYIDVDGPNSEGQYVTVNINNIHFDGGITPSSYDLTQSESFASIFGSERSNYRCINASFGYYRLTIENCEITNYASEIAPAIYVDNTLRADSKIINIKNIKVFNNVCAYDVMQLSNNKVEAHIEQADFYSNYAYKAAGFNISNGAAYINDVHVHDNIFCPFDVDQNNFQLVGGGVFLGGISGKASNIVIENNETIYGGGLGVSSSFTGSSYFVLENITIKNNKAKYGGGVCAFSLAGQPITFINCEILKNEAEQGSSIFVEVYAKHVAKNHGGLVEFFFTTFALNHADDNNAYSFYNAEKTKGELGSIVLKGCLSIGNDNYESKEEDHNYIATEQKAIEDKVISQEMIDNADQNGIYPLKDSVGDVSVQKKEYDHWSDALKDYSGAFKIGKNKQLSSDKANRTVIIISLSSGIALVIIASIVLMMVLKNKNKPALVIENNVDNRKEYFETLNEREKQIVQLMVQGKKRKAIADELNYSENTIKKDLTSIYSKLHINDKFDLLNQYKDYID